MNKKTDHKLFPGPVLRKDDGHLRGQAGHQEVLQLAGLGILLRVHQEARRHPGGIRITLFFLLGAANFDFINLSKE